MEHRLMLTGAILGTFLAGFAMTTLVFRLLLGSMSTVDNLNSKRRRNAHRPGLAGNAP